MATRPFGVYIKIKLMIKTVFKSVFLNRCALEIYRLIATAIVVMLAIILSKPTSFGVPDGLIDSVIAMLTLLGLIIDKAPSDSSIKHLEKDRDNIISYIFNVHTSIGFFYRILYLLLIISLCFLFVYISTKDAMHWKIGVSYLILMIPYFIIYIGVALFSKVSEGKNINPYFICYAYLLLIYVASMLNKFIE